MAPSPGTGSAQPPPPRAPWFVACALRRHPWHLGVTPGRAQRPRARNVPARARAAVQQASPRAQHRFGLPAEARGVRWYEAGREGCGLPRWGGAPGGANVGVDAASLAGNRRPRWAQTERLEVDQ
jgi:hypothetical protein